MARSGPSLAWRMAAAIALTVGFYSLAVAIAVALLAVAILPWVLAGVSNIGVTIVCGLIGATILFAIFPRRVRFDPPGVRITGAEQLRLVTMVEDEARAIGARVPDEVYATLEANAAVAQRRGRRLMLLGLPLLYVLSERGIRAVIAHELAHYAGGDTRMGPWISRTFDGIARTIHHLTDDHIEEAWTRKVVRRPFVWYGDAFMRITAAILRRQEFAADALAARRGGRDAFCDALERIHSYAPAFDAYWHEEVVTVLNAGRRPPVLAGFGIYLRSSAIERLAVQQLEHESKAITDRYDSHPSLTERLAALNSLPPGDPDDSPPAHALLSHPEELEQALLATLLSPEVADMPALAWDDAARDVWLEQSRALTALHGEVLGAATIGDVGDRVRELGRIIGRLQQREPDLSVESARHVARMLLADALLVALEREGWELEARLGEPVSLHRGDACLEPFTIVRELGEDELQASTWRDRATELGIAEVPLAAARAEAEAA